MPRSGTSWLSQIFDSHPGVRFRLSPLFSYEFKNRLNEASVQADWDALFREAYQSNNEFMDQSRRRASGEYPVFAKKDSTPAVLMVKDTRFHNLTRRALTLLPNLSVVSIVRNPCGAIHSWLTSKGEFPSNADPRLEWRTGRCRKTGYGEYWGFDDWKKVTADHLALEKEFPKQVRVVRYEELVLKPVQEATKLFAFLGLELDQQTADFVATSQARHIATDYSVFKNPDVAHRWIKELDPAIRDEIHRDLAGTSLEVFLW